MNKYCGNGKPYIYALFGESDRSHAEHIMEALSAKGHSLWYGDSFDKKEEKRLAKAAALLVVISPEFAESDTLKKAVGQATKANIPIIAAYREWVKLSPGLSMQLGSNLGVVRTNYKSEEEYLEKLCNSPVLDTLVVTPAQKAATKRTTAGFALGAVAAVALVVAVVLYRLLSVVPIDPDSELGRLGLSGNALDVKELYVYGDVVREEYALSKVQPLCTGEEQKHVMEYVLVGDSTETYLRGSLADLTAFTQLTNLEELCLSGAQISDISPLAALTSLKMLDLSCNYLYEADLGLLTQLPELEVLNLAYSNPRDFSPLQQCKSLKTLYVNAESEWNLRQTNLPGVEIIYVDYKVTTYGQLKAACGDESITEIFLGDNITIPAGETLTIPAGTRVYNVPNQAYSFINNGTLEIYGSFRPAFMTTENHGTIVVHEGGLYDVGRGETHNYGEMRLEQDGCLALHEAGILRLQRGSLVNDGLFMARDLAELYFNGGTLENNGTMEFHLLGECYDGDAKFHGDVKKVTGNGSFRIGEEYLMGQ